MVHELCIMDLTGDSRQIWDPTRPDEVEAARETFNKLRKKGYVAYRVDAAGDKATIMTEFDEKAGKVILSPPAIGG